MPRRERPLLAGNYQEKLGIHCRIQNRFCQHGWMINKLFTNNTCLVSRLNSIVFLSVRILLQPNQPMSSSTARSLADLHRVNTMYVEFQSIFDRIIPTATKGKNQMAIYLTNGQKLCFPVCIYSTASWERVERSHFRASIYANVLKTNKGFYIRIRFNSTGSVYIVYTVYR